MRLGDLIAQLQQIRNNYGDDMPVAAESWRGWHDSRVRRVYIGRPEPGDPETVIISDEEE